MLQEASCFSEQQSALFPESRADWRSEWQDAGAPSSKLFPALNSVLFAALSSKIFAGLAEMEEMRSDGELLTSVLLKFSILPVRQQACPSEENMPGVEGSHSFLRTLVILVMICLLLPRGLSATQLNYCC